jgi:hypothetical protein
VNVKRDGSDVDILSTHRNIGTETAEDKFVKEVGGLSGILVTIESEREGSAVGNSMDDRTLQGGRKVLKSLCSEVD